MKNNSMIMTIVVAIIVGAIAFFGGMQYQKSQSTTVIAGQSSFGGRQGGQGQLGRGRGGFGGATVGEVLSIDANSMTVKLQDGSSKIVNLSNTTTFNKTDSASKTDVKTGDRVAAFGMSNSDGSITAQMIQLNPMMRGFGRQGTLLTPTPTK